MMTLTQVGQLDQDEILRGYRDGYAGRQAESLEAAYQHGWNNGIVDRGECEPDVEQRWLAHMYVREQRVDAMLAELKAESARAIQ